MAKHNGPILLDNNAIGCAVDLCVWNGLLGAYEGQLETVREVEIEAGTYFRSKNEATTLMATLSRLVIHEVTQQELSDLAVRTQGIALDPGERDLLANAFGREPSWILCGPDKASIRALVKLDLAHKLISLEKLLQAAGLSTKGLKENQTEVWLRRTIGDLTVKENLG